MAAVLRQLLRPKTGFTSAASPAMLLLVRCCSSAILPAAGASEEMVADSYCYALGKFGKMQFDRQKFIPLKKFMKENKVFEPAPTDRLISPVCPQRPNFTSESAKLWIRSGYLTVHFAKQLKLSISGAFADDNVGVIEGLNIIAFLKLDTNLSSSSVPERYPMTFAGFSAFLDAKMREAYPGSSMSVGLELLMELTFSGQLPNAASVPDHMVLYHPELFPLEVIASLYFEAHRILRREMPANGKLGDAFQVIKDLDVLLGKPYFDFCASDPMVKGWVGRPPKRPGLLGAFSIPAPPGAVCNLNLLTKAERNDLQVLTRKAYSIPAPTTQPPVTVPAPSAMSVSGNQSNFSISPNPCEARVLDVHRHCTVHIVEDASVNRCCLLLPADNQKSLQKNPMGWKDGVHLMLHRFPRYPHYVVVSFQMHGIWKRLDLPSRFPIPQVFYSPEFRHIGV